jgi:hypothetical protein
MTACAPVAPDLDAAAVIYHDLLGDAALVDDSIEALRQGLTDRALTYGDRLLSRSLRPYFLTADRYREAMSAASTLGSALVRLEEAIVADPLLRAELGLSPKEERLALASPDLGPCPSTRLDSFFGPEIRFVEFNGESPAAVAYQDHLALVFDRLPLMQAFRRRVAVRSVPLRGTQLASLLAAYRRWGGRRAPAIAIVDWNGLPTANEFEMFRQFYESVGLRCVICDPRQLALHKGRLYADGERIDLVYRRVLTHELLERPDDGRVLIDACLTGAACVLSTFRAILLHKKMSFGLLTDERLAPLFSAVERDVIARHVPWTRRFRPGPATRSGQLLDDLPSYAADHRENLVLKPNDDCGGRGVVLGWAVGDSEWRAAIERALHEPYVLQEAVEPARELFPIVSGDDVELTAQTVDFDPFLFAGRGSGAVSRLSATGLTNVTSGHGSAVPTYVAELP